MLRLIPPITTLVLLAGLYLEARTHPTSSDAAPFHTEISDRVRAVPYQLGQWHGQDVEVPPEAQKMLRPNALLSRVYADADKRRIVNLVLVQCRDSRDMGSHYPPVCYKGQGWEINAGERVTLIVGPGSIQMTRYTLTRPPSFNTNRQSRLVIYNFFEIPGRGSAPDIGPALRAGSSYKIRPFGAAQIQLVFVDPSMPQAEEESVVTEMLSPISEVLTRLGEGPVESTP